MEKLPSTEVFVDIRERPSRISSDCKGARGSLKTKGTWRQESYNCWLRHTGLRLL
ncbi:hypothetical protein I79_000635 [Cricetulus griseus]|uniref:Uncharacterized protein n=1 Tax=Cricetulus griseus TaxID=10029 RepID=G3GSL8_CRIGR|nr:hypothetical protein I79_000635 [Cricetulus griseus]